MVTVLAAAPAALVVMDVGARLIITGPVETTGGRFFGISIGDPQRETVGRLRQRYGQPTIIMPEPRRGAMTLPGEVWIFYDRGPFKAAVALEFRDERVVRISATNIDRVPGPE